MSLKGSTASDGTPGSRARATFAVPRPFIPVVLSLENPALFTPDP